MERSSRFFSSLLQPCPAHLLFLRPLIPVPTSFLVLDEFPVDFLVNPGLFLLTSVPLLGSGALLCSLLSSSHLLLRFQFDLHLSLPTSQLGFPCHAQPSPLPACLLENSFLSSILIPFSPLCSSSLSGCVSWNEKCSLTSSTLGQSWVLKPAK